MHITKQVIEEPDAIHHDAPQHLRLIELQMRDDQAPRPTRVRDNLLLLGLTFLLPLLATLVLLGIAVLPTLLSKLFLSI